MKKIVKPVVNTFVDTVNGNAASNLFNSSEAISESVAPLQSQQVRQQIGEVFYGSAVPYARRSREVFKQFDSGLKSAGSALERVGKSDALTQKTFQSLSGFNRTFGTGAAFDKASNVAAGAGALYGGDGVGVAQAGANSALSGYSAAAGAAGGKYLGAGVGMVLGGPPGAALGGVVGGVSGAIIGSYGYESKLKPILDKTMDAVSRDLQRKEEAANKIARRIKTDSALLEKSGTPWVIPFEQNPRSPYPIIVRELSASQAEAMHQSAEQIRAQQMVDRAQKNTADNIGARVDLLKTLRARTDDPDAKEKLAREIALLEQRLQNLPLADVLKKVDALNAMRDKTTDADAREKIDRELAFLNQREQKTPDATKKPIEPTAVTTKTPPPPCAGLNEERNSAGVCVCRPGTEAVGGICRPYCAANMTRDGDGTCVCASGYEPLGGACVLKCQPNEERIGGICLTRCGLNEERSAQNICICISGFVPTPKGCAPACGPNETRDEAGKCVCSAGFEKVNGECVPFCAQGEMRTEDGRCVKGYTCGSDSDCPAGFSCNPAGMCADNRPSGEAAVRMRTEVNQGQRNQSGHSQLPLYGQTTTSRPERFGLGQMPGGSTQVLTPLPGTTSTSPQQPQQAGTTTTPTTPSDIACGAGGLCPSGYTCNSRTGVCVKQPQATSTVTNIPTCTTERDCPGAKCVNNVCTSAPATPVQPTKPTTVQPTQQTRQWYVLEAVAGFTVCDLGSTCTAAHKVPCTLTYWAAYGLMQSELQAALQGVGKDLMGLVGGYENARLVSTRVYQGPSTTQLKTPVSGPPSKLECKKP
ncbi:hypothetical protein [Sulfurimicrobium lacus]|uniref:hypothetical protein n=1 Tax=Sulfurimicrobium lacus TaxID=2715678 RepID=UPI001563C33B|nr:hypothetical protein [Sulfurimicrobium lacus]